MTNDLLSELQSAQTEHADAERAENEARSKMSQARNRLNKAQKAIDEWYAKAKKEAPEGTDWRRSKCVAVPSGLPYVHPQLAEISGQ